MDKPANTKLFGCDSSNFAIVFLIIFALLMIGAGVTAWSEGETSILSHGGKAAIISVVLSFCSLLLTPIFGSKSLAMVFFILALIPLWFLYKIRKYQALHNKALKQDK